MKSKDLLQNLTTGILVVCALVVTGLLARRELASPAPGVAQPMLRREVTEWRTYASAGHRLGTAEAPVTIVEFSDFQCPFCRLTAARLDSLRAEFPGQVAVVYRHFPLPSHAHAVGAAQASECADAQGRFWEMHDQLFTNQDSIGRTGWTRFASRAGVPDAATLERCLVREQGRRALQRDARAAERLDVQVTPTLLINDVRLLGAPPLDTLRAYVRRIAEERTGGAR